jgi:hypothetical protein
MIAHRDTIRRAALDFSLGSLGWGFLAISLIGVIVKLQS